MTHCACAAELPVESFKRCCTKHFQTKHPSCTDDATCKHCSSQCTTVQKQARRAAPSVDKLSTEYTRCRDTSRLGTSVSIHRALIIEAPHTTGLAAWTAQNSVDLDGHDHRSSCSEIRVIEAPQRAWKPYWPTKSNS